MCGHQAPKCKLVNDKFEGQGGPFLISTDYFFVLLMPHTKAKGMWCGCYCASNKG